MHYSIGEGRHATVLDFLTNRAQMLIGFLRVLLRLPVLEVDMASALIYIVRNQPGHWSDVAIPGPDGLTGMAIVARALHDG
jgi:hypothetical protein